MTDEGLAFRWQNAKDRITELETELYKWIMSENRGGEEPDAIDSGLYESTYKMLGLPERTPQFRDAYLASTDETGAKHG